MNTKLYVGNLDYSVTDTQLEELFSPYGTVVSASVIVDKHSGRSKGFGFVEMADAASAKAAIDALNGSKFQDRDLTVNEARPLKPRSF